MSDFESIVAGMDMQEPREGEVRSVKAMSDNELVAEYNQVRRHLNRLGELDKPSTREGREVHSHRAAMIVEMRSRDLA